MCCLGHHPCPAIGDVIPEMGIFLPGRVRGKASAPTASQDTRVLEGRKAAFFKLWFPTLRSRRVRFVFRASPICDPEKQRLQGLPCHGWEGMGLRRGCCGLE